MLNLVEKTEPIKRTETKRPGNWEGVRTVCYLGNKETRLFFFFFFFSTVSSIAL